MEGKGWRMTTTMASDLVQVMATVVASLDRSGDTEATLHRITASAGCNIPNADVVSVSVRSHHPEDLRTVAPTDPLATRLDEIQYALREGPCFEAVDDSPRKVVRSGDLSADPRWPQFGALAEECGMRSQLSVQIRDDGHTTCLNLYSRQPDAFTASDDLPELFGLHARAALGHAGERDHLTQAMRTRTDIGKAIGIVMARYSLDDERAFEFLVRVSQEGNIKLRDLAAKIVAIGSGDTNL